MPVTICTPRQKVRMPPKVYQMFRFRGVGKVGHRVVHQPRQRQALIDPLLETGSWDCRSMDRTCLFSSTDLDAGVRQEGVGRHRQILRRRTFADAAGGIVLRAMAMAEPAAIIAFGRVTVGVQPRWVQTPIRISHSGLISRLASVAGALSGRLCVARERIGQIAHRHGLGFGDFLRRCGGARTADGRAISTPPAGPASTGERSTSIEASASAAAEGFIWSMNGHATAATPTAPIAPDAT